MRLFWLTVGSFLLTVELFYLQLTILSFFTYSWSSFAYSFSFFTYSWSFFAYSGKGRLIRALRDCKQRSLTVSKKAPTVSKKASPFPFFPCEGFPFFVFSPLFLGFWGFDLDKESLFGVFFLVMKERKDREGKRAIHLFINKSGSFANFGGHLKPVTLKPVIRIFRIFRVFAASAFSRIFRVFRAFALWSLLKPLYL